MVQCFICSKHRKVAHRYAIDTERVIENEETDLSKCNSLIFFAHLHCFLIDVYSDLCTIYLAIYPFKFGVFYNDASN